MVMASVEYQMTNKKKLYFNFGLHAKVHKPKSNYMTRYNILFQYTATYRTCLLNVK